MGLTEKDRKQTDCRLLFDRNLNGRMLGSMSGRGIWHQDRGRAISLHWKTSAEPRRSEPSDLLQLLNRRIILISLFATGNDLARAAFEELPRHRRTRILVGVLCYAPLRCMPLTPARSLYIGSSVGRMLGMFTDSDAIGDVERTCKVCSILPGVIEASTLPLMALETGIEGDKVSSKDRHWFTLAEAMVRYRLGDSEKALASIRETQLHEGYSQTPAVKALALPLMAMCQYKLGRLEEANQTLDKATSLIEKSWPKLLNDEFGNGWPDWLFSKTLRREAAALLSNDEI